MTDRALLHSMMRWIDVWKPRLQSEGISTRVRPPSTDLEKNSASIEFETTNWLVSAVLWDSGEAESISIAKFDPSDPIVRVSRLKTRRDVPEWLKNLYEELEAAGRRHL